MTLKKLIKCLKDMEILYNDAVVVIEENTKEKLITSICGYPGKNIGCPEPPVIKICVREHI